MYAKLYTCFPNLYFRSLDLYTKKSELNACGKTLDFICHRCALRLIGATISIIFLGYFFHSFFYCYVALLWCGHLAPDIVGKFEYKSNTHIMHICNEVIERKWNNNIPTNIDLGCFAFPRQFCSIYFFFCKRLHARDLNRFKYKGAWGACVDTYTSTTPITASSTWLSNML